MLVELAAALLAAMRSPTHTGYAALGCASHGCFPLLLYAPVSGFQDCELRCAVLKRPPSQHPHLAILFVCVYICLDISIMHVIYRMCFVEWLLEQVYHYMLALGCIKKHSKCRQAECG